MDWHLRIRIELMIACCDQRLLGHSWVWAHIPAVTRIVQRSTADYTIVRSMCLHGQKFAFITSSTFDEQRTGIYASIVIWMDLICLFRGNSLLIFATILKSPWFRSWPVLFGWNANHVLLAWCCWIPILSEQWLSGFCIDAKAPPSLMPGLSGPSASNTLFLAGRETATKIRLLASSKHLESSSTTMFYISVSSARNPTAIAFAKGWKQIPPSRLQCLKENLYIPP